MGTEIQVTTREAALALGVSRRTIQRRALQGTLAAEKIKGGRYIITLPVPATHVAGRWTIDEVPQVGSYTPVQLAKALEMVEQGSVISTGLLDAWITIGSDGETWYPTTLHTCGCKASQNGRACYHRLAVAVVIAIRCYRRPAAQVISLDDYRSAA